MPYKTIYGNESYQAFEMFTTRHQNISKYKNFKLLHNNIDKNCDFNPNRDYLYFLNNFCNIPKNKYPLYFLSLIPDGTNTKTSTIYLLNFVNWAIYYYNLLSKIYESFPKDPSKADKLEAKTNAILVAKIAKDFGVNTSKDKLNKSASNTFKKNKFVLKPTDFLTICSLFARGWFDEHFFSEKYAGKTIEFAYYLTEYIQNSTMDKDSYHCKEYNNSTRYHSKIINKLFDRSNLLDIKFKNFHIQAEKIVNDSKGNNYSYTISINQFSCEHSFYYFSRLYHHRYSSKTDKSLL